MQAKITKRVVDQLQTTGAELWVFDTALPGFCLRVTGKGAKTYWVSYRMGGRDSVKKRFQIGAHGALAPDQARAAAEKVLAGVALGVDPAAKKKAEAEAVAAEQAAKAIAEFTVADLLDRYVAQHVEIRNKPRTQQEVKKLVEKIIKPAIGALPASTVSRAEISNFHHQHRKTPRQANILLAVLSKAFSLAEVWEIRPDGSNPCRLIQRYQETKRERFLTDVELGRVGAALATMAPDLLPSIPVAIRLLAATGCRLDEILKLRWSDVDLDAGVFLIRDTKNGAPRAHHVGAQIIGFLAELPRDSEWVVHGENPLKPLYHSTLQHAWSRIRERAEVGDVRLHDLRHGVGTTAGALGANSFLIRDALGHKTIAMTGRYVNRDANPLRDLAMKVEDKILGALDKGV